MSCGEGGNRGREGPWRSKEEGDSPKRMTGDDSRARGDSNDRGEYSRDRRGGVSRDNWGDDPRDRRVDAARSSRRLEHTRNGRGDDSSEHSAEDARSNRSSRRDEDWRSKRAESSEQVPDLYMVCRGRVHSIRPFGIFVRLDGFRCQGLVHISQVSQYQISQRDDRTTSRCMPCPPFLRRMSRYGHGDDAGGRVKIGCSLKSDGRDLDPNNLQLQELESRPSRHGREKVALEAVYDVVCPRCGGHGHLKNECYASSDKVYELLPEEEEEVVAAAGRLRAPVPRVPRMALIRKRRGCRRRCPQFEEAKALIARLKSEKERKRRAKSSGGDNKKKRKKHKAK